MGAYDGGTTKLATRNVQALPHAHANRVPTFLPMAGFPPLKGPI